MIKGPLARLIAAERRRQRASLLRASVCAVGCAAAAVALLGLSGQFITAAALAGAAGTALAFNYLLPAAAIRGLAILRTGCRYGERLESHRAALGALARIRSALFAALAAAPPEQALSLAAGEACARLVQDVGTVETLFVRQSSRWAAGAALIAGVSLAGLAGWRCAAATVGLFLVSQAAAWGIGRSAGASGAAVQTAVGRLKDSAFALLSAAPELVAYALQDWASARLATDSDALVAAHRRLAMLEGAQGALFAAMGALTAVCVLALAHPAPLPRAALAALGALATVEVGAGLVRGRLRDGAMGEAARRLDPILAFAPERRIDAAPACVALTLRWPLRGRVALAPGERMGVTGRSGAGKTTLLEKLVKLRDCDRGELTLGGADLAGLTPETARGAFAYAPQSALLLSGTVAQTLRLGAPDADEDALWAALFDAGLDLRVEALPGGLQAQIGEGGERLSGGERRRLCLARALLKPAPWLLLDEPTEGLDPQTEALVVERLRRRLDRTRQGLILVSHRPAPLTLCTRTLALDDAVCAPPQARLVQRPNSQWTRNRGKPAVAIRDRVTPPNTHSRAREWP